MDLFLSVLVFGVVVLAASRIGKLCSLANLPLITGFLLAGILVGPDVLQLVTDQHIENLDFVYQVALAIIAMAAGNELVLKEFRSRFRSITWITIGQAVATLSIGIAGTFVLTGYLPFIQEFPKDTQQTTRIAISVLVAVILVARSPSSAIAIINELRSKGPFTQSVLGVTVIMDVAVIVLFAMGAEFAHATASNLDLDLTFIGLLVLEMAVWLLGGYLFGFVVSKIVPLAAPRHLKSLLLLFLGFGLFFISDHLREYSHAHWPFELHLHPLLICMIAGLLVSNTSPHRVEFTRILEQISPPVYLAFFTLTGISIQLDVLAVSWHLALILFTVRLVGIFLGTYAGGWIAGDPPLHRSIGWMSFVTQAGIGIGLAREIATEFPQWGEEVATLLIAVIVFNQLVGPPLMKWSIIMTKECHTRASSPAFDGEMDAVIFGTAAGPSWILAHRLEAHGWNIKLATLDDHVPPKEADSTIEIIRLRELSEESFESLQLSHTDAIITLLTDKENLQICQLNYEIFGIERVVVRLADTATDIAPFRELDALVVEPRNAIVSLLEHFVLSPTGTSMLLGFEPEQDMLEIEIRDPSLHGLFVRDLKLPLDLLVLAVTREGKVVITHGYNRLRLGDHLTIVGPPKSLSEALLYFDT